MGGSYHEEKCRLQMNGSHCVCHFQILRLVLSDLSTIPGFRLSLRSFSGVLHLESAENLACPRYHFSSVARFYNLGKRNEICNAGGRANARTFIKKTDGKFL
eukprot:RCo034796